MRANPLRYLHPLCSLAALSLAVLTSTSACWESDDVVRPIRVGVLANFSGEYAKTSGQPLMEAAQLAAQELNDAGGILVGERRAPVELVFKDFANRADAAATAARALINQDGVDVLIGPPFSRHAIPVAVLAENAAVPMITPMSTSPETTAGKRYVYRMGFLDDFQALAMARFAHDHLDATRAAVVYNVSSTYSRQMAAIFHEAFVALGGEVVVTEHYTTDEDRNYAGIFARVAAARPDVIWLPNYARDTAEQIVAAREQGVEGLFLGGDTWDLELLGSLPESDGAYLVHQWHDDLQEAKTKAFIERYRLAYDRNPKVTAAMTYDAFALLQSALAEQPDPSSESIYRGLRSVEELEGVTGTIRYPGGGDPERRAVISRLEEGHATLYEVVDP